MELCAIQTVPGTLEIDLFLGADLCVLINVCWFMYTYVFSKLLDFLVSLEG